MDLDRNLNSDGKGKYALINLRKLDGNPQTAEEVAAAILRNPEAVEFGNVGTESEFFVIKLKDIHADAALRAYADDVLDNGKPEHQTYAGQVIVMANRAGAANPFCKHPD
jgi:hypothetical protein